jgi:multiple sugar transport system permease protein
MKKGGILEKYTPYIFVLPTAIYFLLFTVYPLFYMFYVSLTDLRPFFKPESKFIGFANWETFLTDPLLGESVLNTIYIIGPAVIIEFFLGFLLALLLYRGMKGEGFLRVLFIVPLMIPPIVAGVIWDLFFSANFGVANFFTEILGIGRIGWLGHPLTARLAIIITDVWQWTPFIFLILLAGLKAIPEYLFEAAQIDGLSDWQTLTNVIIPYLKPAIIVAILIRFIDALKIFDIIFILTRGGPSFSTTIYMYYNYLVGFPFGDFGYAAAMSVSLFLVAILFSIILISFLKIEKRLGWEKE